MRGQLGHLLSHPVNPAWVGRLSRQPPTHLWGVRVLLSTWGRWPWRSPARGPARSGHSVNGVPWTPRLSRPHRPALPAGPAGHGPCSTATPSGSEEQPQR